jgi:hypothetical protein
MLSIRCGYLIVKQYALANQNKLGSVVLMQTSKPNYRLGGGYFRKAKIVQLTPKLTTITC